MKPFASAESSGETVEKQSFKTSHTYTWFGWCRLPMSTSKAEAMRVRLTMPSDQISTAAVWASSRLKNSLLNKYRLGVTNMRMKNVTDSVRTELDS